MVLLENLVGSRKTFRVGYILRNTPWGKQLLNALGRGQMGGRLTIRWTFMAHHFRNDLRSWKRFSKSGGGPIRFYGIHVIALLAEAGYRDVVSSEAFGSTPDEPERWIAVFAGPRLPEAEVAVETKATARAFQIELASPSTTVSFAALGDPFDSDPGSSGTDRRVSALSEVCRSLWDKTGNEYSEYEATNQLWRSVEDRTRFIAN
jgi:predicted dehydrogenase